MKIDWARKLSSRKFWSLLAGLVGSTLVLLKIDANTIVQITAVIGGFASIAIYILSEAYVDGKYAEQPIYEIEIDKELE